MTLSRGLLLQREFELRIFVSLGIVASVYAVCALAFPLSMPLMAACAAASGLPVDATRRVGFLFLAVSMALISLLRMWAGTELSARRVMAFRVQTDRLQTAGPYLLVRNPIYLADFLAICSFALCLPPAGLAMPLLFYCHYMRLIFFEEKSLGAGFQGRYEAYRESVPRLLPNQGSLRAFARAAAGFRLSREGIRHNALYVLFIPGFLAAAWLNDFLPAVVIGVPGVLDWAVIHTRIGVRP
jgi:protein-S-isoprenylcysteine O-methyltransferase Ste14